MTLPEGSLESGAEEVERAVAKSVAKLPGTGGGEVMAEKDGARL